MHMKLSEVYYRDMLFLIFQMLMKIFTLYIFLFLHDQKSHSVLVCTSLDAEKNPWTEHQDASRSR